eukprot:1396425-Pyramimonas_sp.AAC.1
MRLGALGHLHLESWNVQLHWQHGRPDKDGRGLRVQFQIQANARAPRHSPNWRRKSDQRKEVSRMHPSAHMRPLQDAHVTSQP